MSRRSIASPWSLSLTLAAFLVCILSFAAAPSAHAGFGDLVKKAKDKATGKDDAKEEDGDAKVPSVVDEIVFDSAVLELTEQRLGKFLSAHKKAGGASAARTELVAKVEALNDERNKLIDKHGEKIQNVQQKRDDVEGCRHEGYNEAQDRRAREYADKALTDPAIREKFTRIAAENNAAAMRGDSTAINRANAAMMSEILPTREDTLAVQKKCGPIPPPLPAEGALTKLDADLATANDNLRAYDDKVAKDQAKESGMNPEQFAIAWERVRNYCAWRGKKPQKSMRGYSDEEVAALEKRIAEVCATRQ